MWVLEDVNTTKGRLSNAQTGIVAISNHIVGVGYIRDLAKILSRLPGVNLTGWNGFVIVVVMCWIVKEEAKQFTVVGIVGQHG